MKIAVLGTGMVGNAIGSKLAEIGHSVIMGSRTKGNEKALEFVNKNPGNTSEGTFAEAADFGEIIFNCTRGEHSLDVMRLAGSSINGKIVVDVSNPLDFSHGMPPTLIPSLSNSTSLGEEIQKAFPEAKVVKTLNTMWNGLMGNPNLIGNGDHINYISGNDAEAKSKVIGLLNEMGWKKENILDLGDISAARGTEGYLLLWLRIYGAMGSGAFNLSLVK